MINEKQRFHQVRRSYAHIYSRIKEHQEMLRILEAPSVYRLGALDEHPMCRLGRGSHWPRMRLSVGSQQLLPMGSRQFFR